MNFTNQERKYIQREIERMQTGWYQIFETNTFADDVSNIMVTHVPAAIWKMTTTKTIYSLSSTYGPNVYLYNWVLQNMVHKFL